MYSDCIVCPSIYNFWLALLCIQNIVCPKIYNFWLILGVFRLHCLSFDLQLLVTPLVHSDCIGCPSIYNFWLPLWCIQNVLSVLRFTTSDIPLWCIQTVLFVLWFTTSGYHFGVFRFYCLSLDLQLGLVILLSVLRFTTSGYPFCVFRLLSVLQFTTSDYPFGVFRLHCLSFDLQLLVTPLVYSDCIVCPLIYNFWLPLLCIQTVLSVLSFTTSGYSFVVFRLLSVLRFTTSGYPFGVFRLYCLSFYLQLLVTPLVYSDCIVCPSIYNFWYTPLVYSDCIVCPSIYNFWLPLCCIQTALSVLRFTTTGYPFGVFRLYCLSFDLQLLVTPLVYSDCIVCP